MPLLLNLLLRQLGLIALIRLAHRHLTGKIPRRDRIHPHLQLLELATHHLAQVHGGALGGVVGEVALGVAHEPGHAGDDDDGCGPGGVGSVGVFGGGLEEGEEGEGGEVNGGDVGGEDGGPVGDGFGVPEGTLEGVRVRGGRGGLGAGDAGVGYYGVFVH